MQNKHRSLGKGFESLIPQGFDSTILADREEPIRKLPINMVKPNPHQPRQHFDETFLIELSESIKRHGILQPLVVTPLSNNRYQIIAGERRWRAAQLAGLDKVPAVVRTTKQLDQLELALVENVQRVDLSPLEQAVSIQKLHEQFSQEYTVIAKRLGKALSTVQNIVRLLQLPTFAQEALHKKQITEGHARAILALKDVKSQKALLKQICAHGWSVRQAERYVVAHKQGVKTPKAVQKRVQTTTAQTQKLSDFLHTSVSVRRMAKGGKLEITFKNDAELKNIIGRIVKIIK